MKRLEDVPEDLRAAASAGRRLFASCLHEQRDLVVEYRRLLLDFGEGWVSSRDRRMEIISRLRDLTQAEKDVVTASLEEMVRQRTDVAEED